MTDRPHPRPPAGAAPIARGREADVFALDSHRVLRRYRRPADVTDEAQVMAYVAGLGYPVPEVFEAHGADMVMERLDGTTLTEAMLDGDVTLDRGAATLADLLRRLHDLEPWDHAEAGYRLVHLDLHPDNVMLTSRGPVVIDWCNATDAPADLDTAVSALILAMAAVDTEHAPRAALAGQFLDAFLPIAPGDPTRQLDRAMSLRARQLNLPPGETGVLATAAARIRGDR